MHRISVVILSVWLRSYAQGCKSASGYGVDQFKKLLTSTVDFQDVKRGFLVFQRGFCEFFFVVFVCFLFWVLLLLLLREEGVFLLHREM